MFNFEAQIDQLISTAFKSTGNNEAKLADILAEFEKECIARLNAWRK